VAEFIGDLETRRDLNSMGVRLGQGEFLGPSRDVEEITALQAPPHPEIASSVNPVGDSVTT